MPDNKQGRYQRSRGLWSSEELNKKPSRFICENANVKGQLNLTSASFCSWVIEELLPNECLQPGISQTRVCKQLDHGDISLDFKSFQQAKVPTLMGTRGKML